MSDAPYVIYERLLSPLGHGKPIFNPNADTEEGRVLQVELGDVGYVSFGHFIKVTNVFAANAQLPRLTLQNVTTSTSGSGLMCSSSVKRIGDGTTSEETKSVQALIAGDHATDNSHSVYLDCIACSYHWKLVPSSI
jgi:hypothetical protein